VGSSPPLIATAIPHDRGRHADSIYPIREQLTRSTAALTTTALPQAIASAIVNPNGSGCVLAWTTTIQRAIYRHRSTWNGTKTYEPAQAKFARHRLKLVKARIVSLASYRSAPIM